MVVLFLPHLEQLLHHRDLPTTRCPSKAITEFFPRLFFFLVSRPRFTPSAFTIRRTKTGTSKYLHMVLSQSRTLCCGRAPSNTRIPTALAQCTTGCILSLFLNHHGCLPSLSWFSGHTSAAPWGVVHCTQLRVYGFSSPWFLCLLRRAS